MMDHTLTNLEMLLQKPSTPTLGFTGNVSMGVMLPDAIPTPNAAVLKETGSTSFTLSLLVYLWETVVNTPWAIPIFLAAVPFITYGVTTIQFHRTRVLNKTRKSSDLVVPTAPYWIPYLGHAISMALDTGSFIDGLMERYGTDQPLIIQVAWLRFTVLGNPDHIQTVFKNSRHLTNKPVTSFVLENLLAASKKIIAFYDADDSGMAAKARPGSKVKPEDRVYYFQIRTAHRYLSGQHLHSLNERFAATLDRDLDRLEIGSDWVEFADLYRFLQLTVTHSSIETVFGEKLLELNPSFVEDFWDFEVNAPALLHCMPRWIAPTGYRVRDKLIKSFEKWHAYANANYDCSKTGPEDPEWEPNFGSKLIRTRQDGLLKMEPMDAEARASEDLGLMFGLNANVLPCIFWYIIESLRKPEVHAALMADIEASTDRETGRIDIQALGSQPLTQSMHAEILRLYIAILTLRNGEVGAVHFAGYNISKEDLAIIYSRTGAMNDRAWADAGRPPTETPLDRFDAERFLVEPQGEVVANADGGEESTFKGRQFSMDGLAGVFLPFGGGDRMCPGRHYAKTEMLMTFAHIFTKFDFELLDNDTVAKVQPNMGFAPFGSLPPTCQVPFRIRRKSTPL